MSANNIILSQRPGLQVKTILTEQDMNSIVIQCENSYLKESVMTLMYLNQLKIKR